MAQKLSEQINRYFNLMESIRKQLYRVLPVSDRYLCVVSFSTQLQALQCVLVSKESLMEAKLLEGLTGAELTAYGQYMQLAEQWVAGGMQAEYPFTQDQDVYAEFRNLTQDEEEEEEDLDAQELDNLRTSILCADKPWLMQAFVDANLGTKSKAADMDAAELQEALCEHYGLNPDVDVAVVDTSERRYSREQLNNIRCDILSYDRTRLAELVQSFGIANRHSTRGWTEHELRHSLFKFYGIDEDTIIEGTQRNETTAEYIQSLSRHAALKELSHLDMTQLHTLADVWGLDKSDDLNVMLSIAKGHILRSLKADYP